MVEVVEKVNQFKLDKASNDIKTILTTQKNEQHIFRSISKLNIGNRHVNMNYKQWLQEPFFLLLTYQPLFNFNLPVISLFKKNM